MFTIEPKLLNFISEKDQKSLITNYSHELWANSIEGTHKIGRILYDKKLYDLVKILYKYNMEIIPEDINKTIKNLE